MNNRKFYKAGLIISIVLVIGSFCLPKSMGDTPALIMAIGMLCFLVFLIALIVSGIRAKKQPKSQPEPAKEPVAKPAPATQAAQPKPAPKKATSIERVYVNGISHYTKNIKAVAMENPDYKLSMRELKEDFLDERVWQYQFFVKAALVPEPDNEYDPNAIMVQADGLCIGHIPRERTTHIRNLMDSGRIKYLDLKIGGGKYKKVTEVDDDEYELDHGENPYSAALEIHLTEE